MSGPLQLAKRPQNQRHTTGRETPDGQAVASTPGGLRNIGRGVPPPEIIDLYPIPSRPLIGQAPLSVVLRVRSGGVG
jgi:hypothetical protein